MRAPIRYNAALPDSAAASPLIRAAPMAKKKQPTTFTRVRSAVTGRFVTRSQAKRSPRTTVSETFRRSTGKKKKR